MVTRRVELTEEQNKELEATAAARGQSFSEVVRARLHATTPTIGQHSVDREELKRRVLQLSGRFRSGVTDLAVEHDRYLEEAYGD